MNVEDYEAAALHEIVDRVEAEARARGVEVAGAELVGLMPVGAAAAAAGAVLRIEGFNPRTSSRCACSRAVRKAARLLGARLRRVRSGTAIRLTGEDLRIDDVWAVAFGAAEAVLSDDARTKMRAARKRRRPRRARPQRAHLRRQHRFRALRLPDDPGGADRGAAAATAAKPCLRGRRAVSGRDRPRGDGAAGQRAREGELRRSARARRAAARLSRPRGAAASCRAAARWVRAATSHRSRISPCRSSARARPGSTATCCPARRRSKRPGSSRRDSPRRKGCHS